MNVENQVPGVKSWKSNSNFQMLEVEFGISNFPLLGVESWSLISGSWKLDSSELVWTNSHINTFSAQKRAENREKTAVFKRGNLPKETPVETREDPRGPAPHTRLVFDRRESRFQQQTRDARQNCSLYFFV